MKTFGALVGSALFAVLFVAPVYAQQPGTSHDQHHPESAAGSSTTPSPAPAPGMKAETMPMTDMCRQMMSDMMGMAAIGGAPADRKEKSDMLQMRGEMMKAMGDIMMKHARRMQGMTSK